MEIEEQNAINLLEIKKKKGEIMLLRKSEASDEAAEIQKAEEIKSINKTIQTLKLSTQKNILKK